MCLGMFLLGLILYETLHFLDLGDWFLSPVKKFSAIISSDIFSGPVSSPSGIPIMGMLMCHMLPQRSLKTILIFSFFFSVLQQWFPPLFLPAPWSIPPHLFCYRFLLVYFPFQLLYSTTLSGWSLYFLTLLKTFCNFSHPFFPWGRGLSLQSLLSTLSWADCFLSPLTELMFGGFILFLCLEHTFFHLILSKSVWIFVYVVGWLCFSALEKWPSAGDVLCIPAVLSPPVTQGPAPAWSQGSFW